MKNNLASLLACAAAVNLSSCVSRQGLPGAYMPHVFAPDPLQSLINQVIESAVDVISDNLDDVDTAEEAEDLADTMDSLLTAIEDAKILNIKVPDQAIEAYNEALEHLVKNNYFGSDHLRTALKDACLLKVQ